MEIYRECRGEVQQFLILIHVLQPTRGENVLDLLLSSQNELEKMSKYMSHWVTVIKIKYILTSK